MPRKLRQLRLVPRAVISKFQKFRRTSNSSRRHWVIQNSQLREHRGPIPVEILVGDFAGLKPACPHCMGVFNKERAFECVKTRATAS